MDLQCTSLPCQYDGSAWVTADSFVVDSDGPAILSLPASHKLKLVTLHCTITTPSAAPRIYNANTLTSLTGLVTSPANTISSWMKMLTQQSVPPTNAP